MISNKMEILMDWLHRSKDREFYIRCDNNSSVVNIREHSEETVASRNINLEEIETVKKLDDILYSEETCPFK